MSHGYQVPVDKHDSDETFTPSPDPLVGVKGRVFKFRYNSVRSIFLRKFRIQTEVQKIRNISNVIFDGRPLYVPPGT